jgi:nucleoside-diphosphate-sugar epimerase
LVDRNIPLPFLNINNRRSLIYLGNLVDAIITCCTHPNVKAETFLVSDGEDVSTPELIKMIASVMGKKAKLFPFPQSLLKIMGTLIGNKEELDRLLRSLCVDSSKIRKVLNWTPPFSMRDGINETVKSYKNSSTF